MQRACRVVLVLAGREARQRRGPKIESGFRAVGAGVNPIDQIELVEPRSVGINIELDDYRIDERILRVVEHTGLGIDADICATEV